MVHGPNVTKAIVIAANTSIRACVVALVWKKHRLARPGPVEPKA
jgi:hypothetical protein